MSQLFFHEGGCRPLVLEQSNRHWPMLKQKQTANAIKNMQTNIFCYHLKYYGNKTSHNLSAHHFRAESDVFPLSLGRHMQTKLNAQRNNVMQTYTQPRVVSL